MGRGGAPSVSAYQWGSFGPGLGETAGGQGGGLDGQWEVLEELAQPLIVTPEVVLTLQSQLEAALTNWHRNTAPEALKGRLTAAEFTATLEELSSEATVKLLVTLINFMHEEFVRGHPDFPEFLEARLMSREGLRSQQSRRQEQLLEDRGLSSSTGEGLGLAGTLRQRSMSRSAGQHSVQSSIRTQQMTSLQKYDLGYQAYVKQKLEVGSRQGAGAPPPPPPPPLTSRSGASRAGVATARSHVTIARGAGGGAGGRGASPWDSPDGLEGARVSFAVAPHYHDHDSDTDPGSPAYRSVFSGTTARSAASGGSLWGGPLSLPGAASARSVASRSVASEAVSQVPDLPPRVGNALKHSASFKMASAATTARAIHSSLGDSDLAALQSERLFALHVDFATRFKSLRQSRSGMFFTLPILLLSMRLCVNTLFSTLYPLWTRLPEGAQVLDHMDEAIRALFDPHGYLERALSLLQSTPTAIEAVTRHPQRRGTERQHFNDTSPLLQATMQGAKSAGARKLLKSSANQPHGRSLLRTQLTAAQRAALFQRGLQWMQQPDPMLSQIGEPQAVGR